MPAITTDSPTARPSTTCVREGPRTPTTTGRGVRIRGGTAQSYYVGVESNMPAIPGMEPPLEALCLAPFGMEEGSEAALSNLLNIIGRRQGARSLLSLG